MQFMSEKKSLKESESLEFKSSKYNHKHNHKHLELHIKLLEKSKSKRLKIQAPLNINHLQRCQVSHRL